jgi:uncharacterized membrane protein YgaE (UPF0421/DUF939 family)
MQLRMGILISCTTAQTEMFTYIMFRNTVAQKRGAYIMANLGVSIFQSLKYNYHYFTTWVDTVQCVAEEVA